MYLIIRSLLKGFTGVYRDISGYMGFRVYGPRTQYLGTWV